MVRSLTPEEEQRYAALKAALKELDLSGSGKFTIEEFSALLGKCGDKLTPTELQDILSDAVTPGTQEVQHQHFADNVIFGNL